MGSKFFHEWFCDIEDGSSDEMTSIEQHINEEKILSAMSADARIEEVAETTPPVDMGSSSPNDKPVLVVKEDPTVFEYLDDITALKKFTLSAFRGMTNPAIMETLPRRDELLSDLTKLGKLLAFPRNKPIDEVIEGDRKHLPYGLSFGNQALSVHLIGPLPQITVIPDNPSSNNQYHSVDQKNGVAEELKRSSKNRQLEQEIFLSFRNDGDHHSTNLSSIWSDFRCSFDSLEECPPNHFTALPVNKEKQRSITGNMSSRLDKNELYWSNNTYEYNQHIIRKEIVRRSSSLVVSIIVVLGIFYTICSSQLSIINVPPLHKEHNVSIWLSLLGLFGFMVFVCAVAVMIIVRAPFTSMQKYMLIFWAILMHLQSANSSIEVYLTLVGGLLMVWYTFGKKQPPNDVMM